MSGTINVNGTETDSPSRTPSRIEDAFKLPPPPSLPLRGRVVRTLRRILPFVAWAALAALGARLWLVQGIKGEALAYAETVEVRASPGIEGRIRQVSVEPGQKVSAGEVIATMDVSDLDDQSRTLRADLERVRAQIAADTLAWQAEQSERADLSAARQRTFDIDLARLQAEIDRMDADQAALGGEAAGIDQEIARLRSLVENQQASEARLQELLQRRGEIEARRANRAATLAGTKERLAAWRPVGAESAPASPLTTRVAPHEHEIRVIESKLADLERRRSRCQIMAPATGVVGSVALRGGEWARAGAEVATIVVTRPGRLLAYATYDQIPTIQPGVKVTLRPHDHRGAVLHGKVVALAPLIEPAPARLKAILTTPPFGRLATIAVDGPAEILPNEIYDARFER